LPDDGFYTITNNTTTWGSFGQFWDDMGDNSPDHKGYMMVVNATYNPGLFYVQTVDGLCENTEYYFSADIYNIIVGDNWIKPNVSFLLNGQEVYNTCVIEETHTWETYGLSFVT